MAERKQGLEERIVAESRQVELDRHSEELDIQVFELHLMNFHK